MTRPQLNLPRFSFHHTAHRIAIAILVSSVIFGALKYYAEYLLFIPLSVIYQGRVWQLFTSLLVATSPMEIIFGALIAYSIGSELERSWGARPFLWVVLGIPFLGMILTLAIAFLMPGIFLGIAYAGASAVLTTMWISYGLSGWFSGRELNFWGVPLSGKTFAYIGLGFVVLQGLFSSWVAVLPDLLSAGITYHYMYRPRDYKIFKKLELFYYNLQLKRLKSKPNLHIVKNTERKSEKSSNRSQDDDFTIH